MSHHQHIDYKVTTGPDIEPVTLAEAKANLRVDTSDDDTMIDALIVAARIWCELYQNRAYITQTITLKMDHFQRQTELPRSPLASVTSINYLDQAQDSQLLSTDIYDVDTLSEPGLVTLARDESFPTISREHHAVTIVYVAGYGATADTVPQEIKQAILLLVAHWYEHRYAACDAQQYEIPFGVKSLLSIDRCFA